MTHALLAVLLALICLGGLCLVALGLPGLWLMVLAVLGYGAMTHFATVGWGTIIAVLVLAIGIAGLQQLGNSFFVEPIFQGAALIISVGLAGYPARRRKR